MTHKERLFNLSNEDFAKLLVQIIIHEVSPYSDALNFFYKTTDGGIFEKYDLALNHEIKLLEEE